MPSLALQKALYPLLYPFGKLYGVCMKMRRNRYARRSKNAEVIQPMQASNSSPKTETHIPCVSVGNISWGGSGKTPVVSWILNECLTKGIRPCVLTRGYKAKPHTLPYAVTQNSSAAEAGDEPLMLARQYPTARIIVDPVRRRGADYARAHEAPQIFILDDGFQHLAMPRDLDIVLLHLQELGSDWNRVIPSGSWRENASALNNADVFCIKCSEQEFSAARGAITKRLAQYGKPVYGFSLRIARLVPLNTCAEQSDFAPSFSNTGDTGNVGNANSAPANLPYHLVSAVGQPAQVAATVAEFLCYSAAKHSIFPDHHAYSEADMQGFCQKALPLICTPKDAAKFSLRYCELLSQNNVPAWTLELATHFHSACLAPQNAPTFSHWWHESIKNTQHNIVR